MLTVDGLNVLGSVINTTFGKPSSPTGTHSVVLALQGDELVCNYTTIVHFASDQGLNEQMPRIRDEATSITDDVIKRVKDEFKESAGRRLKVKKSSECNDLELISTSTQSPKKVAYYRVHGRYAVSE